MLSPTLHPGQRWGHHLLPRLGIWKVAARMVLLHNLPSIAETFLSRHPVLPCHSSIIMLNGLASWLPNFCSIFLSIELVLVVSSFQVGVC